MVNASRAWKYVQTRCMTFLKWHTKVSIDAQFIAYMDPPRFARTSSCDQIPPDLVVKFQAIDIVEVI
jgi:hypothetical protein